MELLHRSQPVIIRRRRSFAFLSFLKVVHIAQPGADQPVKLGGMNDVRRDPLYA